MLMDELRTEMPQSLRNVVARSGSATNRLAHEIVSALPQDLVTRIEEYPDRIQIRLARREGFEIQRVVLGRNSLERLERDPHRDVKIEYLRRELAGSAGTRRTWAYPRTLTLR